MDAPSAPESDPEHGLRRLTGSADRRLAPRGRTLVDLVLGPSEAAQRGLDARTHRDYEQVERVLELWR